MTTILEALDYDDEFTWVSPSNAWMRLCGLCGNSGMLDTRPTAVSGAGIHSGIHAPCLCANGRAIKRGRERAEALQAAEKGKKLKPSTFWVSWNVPNNEPDPLAVRVRDPRLLGTWISGEGDSYCCFIAWIKAKTTEEVIVLVNKHWPTKGERDWRFMSPRDRSWRPPADRFPGAKKRNAGTVEFIMDRKSK